MAGGEQRVRPAGATAGTEALQVEKRPGRGRDRAQGSCVTLSTKTGAFPLGQGASLLA